MRSAIFIPAYEAQKTLEQVVRRIPAEVYAEIDEIVIQDDASGDETFTRALDLAQEFDKITAVRNDKNLGYGGTQKKAYDYCIGRGHDLVVMLHGDGQHAPESLPDMLKPIVSGDADIVLGSRMLGDPLGSGMPLYKWVGNCFLTYLANLTLGLCLTDYHTGYRAYRCPALCALDVQTCSNGHPISMELLVRAARERLVIAETPVPTSYGPGSRSCSPTTSIQYGLNVLALLVRHRFENRA